MARRRLSQLIADPYSGRSVSSWTRGRRWEEIQRRYPDLGDMRVLDLGGVERHWTHAPVRPREVVLLNLPDEREASDMEVVVGDACRPPAELFERGFDLVYSNSVIEHVGGFAKQAEFAGAVKRLAPHHWIQTPYRYFPIEPHWLFPGFQFLPVRLRVAATRRWPLGHRRERDPAEAADSVLSVQLLGRTEMRSLFPDSDLWSERLGGLTKSIVATR